ncbi:bifunctional diaminohydroxyphosphoribosylaminopyrimidine deaminase/5-amino-6-(5-phosphoribosylamino)uracil reductase RibD [Ferroacidibacillus organovorans]|uniref:Riboflavin biosynthesis protein RibD n=1 Tax=Ferroacidibacillus organovorans TaxID=1765683 RepID=A0A101XQW9_9BACL|nr:bifunctional diaminohydroxyphosphoribosylaminopyrimidine deaminase/5-amino-6-(5-phosphoribosylamino)uracil reductase RibD [Ferroacidibacillus organovorans]KUO95872.1 hypothetical protein ATW55_09065 [Ferroacidibacillus organovorans]
MIEWSSTDLQWMDLALTLARATRGQTHPNPQVGAVLVADGQLIGLGSHLKAGESHAEVHALKMAGERARGATLYVTLEPCAHVGKTPPCADAVIRAGIARVVVALEDPDPRVAGLGISRMREAGIAVEVGCRHAQTEELLRPYLHVKATGLPYVTLKLATTLDGYLATSSGESLYMTGDAARAAVHRLRAQVDAVCVGIGTVLADDPRLTVRLEGEFRQPARVVFDRMARLPINAHMVSDGAAVTHALVSEEASSERIRELRAHGVHVTVIGSRETLTMRAMLHKLVDLGFVHVLIEGGSSIAAALIKEQLATELWWFHAPLILGQGMPALGKLSIASLRSAVTIENPRVEVFGSDVLTRGSLKYT